VRDGLGAGSGPLAPPAVVAVGRELVVAGAAPGIATIDSIGFHDVLRVVVVMVMVPL
jgi:hypothetical protein